MFKVFGVLFILGSASLSVPAVAREYRGPVYSDSNPHYLDYKTDISEAKRELRSDLARANDRGDVRDAWDEYYREIADARHDFRKEMDERGVNVRRGRVTVED